MSASDQDPSKQQADSRQPDLRPRRFRSALIGNNPRIETWILICGLASAFLGKCIMVRRQSPPGGGFDMMFVLAPDLLFFGGVFLLVRLAYLMRPSAWMARGALLLCVLVTAWSILNTCWLFESGAQFQPGVLLVLLLNVREVWPLVRGHVGLQPGLVICLGGLLAGGVLLVVWRLIRPRAIAVCRARQVRILFVGLIVLLAVALIRPIVGSRSRLGFAGDVLGFSSHWYALRSLVIPSRAEQLVHTRNIPLRGDRMVTAPADAPDALPNIVIVLLESVPYAATSMADPQRDTTPFLGRLARDGVEFRRTRSVVAQTTKAFWTVLTSTTPVIEQGYVEAVPVSVPYESLATLLRPAGYRSAFFEMSKGSFECAPGLFHNLGFDWAWFRENLEDPSSHLGYMSGDDLRMLEPAMQWVERESGPFLLMFITSVSHHPFQLPGGFGQVSADPYENYLQTVRYADMFLARLWDRLERCGRADHTILCVLGDHGTSFRLQMGKGRWIPYEEVTRIPWVIYWPGHLSRRDPVEWPCSQLDVTPTLLRLVGFDISRAGFEGYNALEPIPADRRRYCATLYANSPLGYIQQDRKVIYWPYIDKVFLYDLAADPGEEHPLTAAPPDALRYKEDISAWQQRSQIYLNAKRHTKQRIYEHWWVFSTGRTAWSYYVP